MSNLAGLPSDDTLLAEIREILKTADLMSVTKKDVRVELERRFGVSLEAKRAYIKSGMYFLPISVYLFSNTLETNFPS